MDRLFVVCAVLDGVPSDTELEKELKQIDRGSVPHWHGATQHQHDEAETNESEDEHPHGKKIHILYSKEKRGIAAARADAVDFIALLEKKHVQAGIKSPDEDLILVLLRSGATLVNHKWLPHVTSALIIPPPLLKDNDSSDVALKIANAVSFGIESMEGATNQAVAFDYSFKASLVQPSGKDLALSNGDSYPSPALTGGATAMRLETYRSLPAQDMSLEDEWQANLDLSLNLWLCADGIDVLADANVYLPSQLVSVMLHNNKPLPPADAARFAAAWMEPKHQDKVLEKLLSNSESGTTEFTKMDWEVYRARSMADSDFPFNMQKKCRPFSWYESEINQHMEVTQEDLDEEEERKARAVI